MYISTENHAKTVRELKKYTQFFNVANESLDEYKQKNIFLVAENRALATALSRCDKNWIPTPNEEIDEMYQNGYEKWKKENPEFVKRFNL